MNRSLVGLTLVPAGIIAVVVTAGTAHAAGTSGTSGTAPHAVATASAYPPPPPTTSFSSSVLGTVITKAPATPDGVEPVSVTTGTSGTLPFTGADIVGTSVVGIALVGGGAAAVVAGRRRRGGSHR